MLYTNTEVKITVTPTGEKDYHLINLSVGYLERKRTISWAVHKKRTTDAEIMVEIEEDIASARLAIEAGLSWVPFIALNWVKEFGKSETIELLRENNKAQIWHDPIMINA